MISSIFFSIDSSLAALPSWPTAEIVPLCSRRRSKADPSLQMSWGRNGYRRGRAFRLCCAPQLAGNPFRRFATGQPQGGSGMAALVRAADFEPG